MLCVKLVNCLTLDSKEKCLDLNNIFCCLTGRGILLGPVARSMVSANPG